MRIKKRTTTYLPVIAYDHDLYPELGSLWNVESAEARYLRVKAEAILEKIYRAIDELPEGMYLEFIEQKDPHIFIQWPNNSTESS